MYVVTNCSNWEALEVVSSAELKFYSFWATSPHVHHQLLVADVLLSASVRLVFLHFTYEWDCKLSLCVGVHGSHGSSSFVVLGRLHIVFCSSRMDVHSPYQYVNAPLHSHPHQYLLSFGITSGKSLSDEYTRNFPWRSLCLLNSFLLLRYSGSWVSVRGFCDCVLVTVTITSLWTAALSALHDACSFWKVSSHAHCPVSTFFPFSYAELPPALLII